MGQDARMNSLNARHAELENRIELEEHRPLPDDVTLSDLKRQKLRIKDELSRIRHS